MLDVRKLRLLVALDQHGTIAAAADELHLTASGISMQLSALERELRITLTERQGRRLALTPAGRLLVEHGRDIVDRLSLAELEIDALRRGAAGTYRIAAFPSAARTIVATAWHRLLVDGAGIDLTLTTLEPEDALAELVAGRTDLALVHAYSNLPRRTLDGVDVTAVMTEPIWLAVHAEDPAAAAEVDLRGLADHAWITPQRTLTCYEMTDRACGLAGFRPRIVAESADFAVQLELVAAGVGVALVPELAVGAVPAGVRLARPAVPLHRHTMAAARTSMRGDSGLAVVTNALIAAARPPARPDALSRWTTD